MRNGGRANCLIDENESDRGFDGPAKSRREIFGRHRRAKRDARTMLEHDCTEPAARRGSDRGDSGLDPAQPQPRPAGVVPYDRPCHADFALVEGDGAILQRVRRKLMNREPDRFRRRGEQDKVQISVEVNSRSDEAGHTRKLARDQRTVGAPIQLRLTSKSWLAASA